MQLNKRFIGAGLIIVILSLPVLLILYLQICEFYIRHEMEEKLEKQHLQTVRMEAADIFWFRENKELIIDNKLFDVKSYSLKDGIAEFTGIFDDKETAIHQQMKELEKNSDHKSIPSKIAFLFLYQGRWDNFLIPPLICLPATGYTNVSVNLLSADLSISTPPPRA